MPSKPTKFICTAALFLSAVLTAPVFAQDKVFDWRPANDESVQLDPANYHTARVYHAGDNGGSLHVDIDAKQPITVEMAPYQQWNDALRRQHDDVFAMSHVDYRCVRDHVVKATYVCELPPDQPMVLVLHDERDRGKSAIADIGAVFGNHGARRFVSPNDIHIQYYNWTCIQNCLQPEFQWVNEISEKYKLTPILKSYGGLQPDRDGESVSIRINAPVPMAVAVLPTSSMDQLYQDHSAFESVLAGSTCKQRGVQSLTFQCTLNAADGPQSLIVVPEPG